MRCWLAELLPGGRWRRIRNHFDFGAPLQFLSRGHLDDLSAHHWRARRRTGRRLHRWRDRRRCVREQFHIKNQDGFRRNLRRKTASPIAQIRRDDNLPLGTNFHHRQNFGPTFDGASGHRRGKFVILIEDLAVNRGTLVTDRYGIVRPGHGAGAVRQYLILQPVRKRFKSRLVGIFGQKRIALGSYSCGAFHFRLPPLPPCAWPFSWPAWRHSIAGRSGGIRHR